MNHAMIILYDAIEALEKGQVLYEVIPEVPEDKIDKWTERLIEEGFYVKVDTSGGETNIYYASPLWIERFCGEYTMDGWSN